jgi:hypothetical protein
MKSLWVRSNLERSSEKNEDPFRAAIIILRDKEIPQEIANELLIEARRRGFRLEVFVFSDLDPPDEVAILFPLINHNHSVTLSIITKKLVPHIGEELTGRGIDVVYVEKSVIEKVRLELEKRGLNLKIFDGGTNELEA